MCLTHIIGLVILCAVVAAAEDLVDVTMLTRNFVYGPRISPKLDCYVPPGVYARLSYSLGRPTRFSVGITRGPTNTIFDLNVPRRVSLHPRTTLYECAVNGSEISTVISPAMYYDRRDGPTFLPENFTVTANLNETATLRIQGAPGYNYVYPHVTSWAKVTFDRKEVSKTLATGNKTSLTIPRAGRGESGVYVARGPPHRRPGRNRAVIRLIVRSCKRGLWGKYCRNRCPDCKNGGLCHVESGKCLCPPGFKGQLCEEGE